MFDTMTATKVVGALCGSLLVFLLGGWAADKIYGTGPYAEESPAEGEEVEQAYVIDTGEAVAEAAPAEEGPAFDVVFASADAAAGERVFNRCASCHKVNGANGVGPYLNGVVGREKASLPDYEYSAVLAGMRPDVWSPENLDGFLANPKEYAPGTKMSFAGLSDVEDRANVIAWLATQQ